jgi:hypothetical protein
MWRTHLSDRREGQGGIRCGFALGCGGCGGLADSAASKAAGTSTKGPSLPLGPAATLRLAGLSSNFALLRGSRRLVLVHLDDGKLVSLPLSPRPHAASGVVDARLTGAGLFYAYNLPRAFAKGRIVFEPTAKLLAHL